MNKKIQIKKSQVFLLLFVLTLFVLSAPHIIKSMKHGDIIMGDEPYYHARVARQITSQGIPSEDSAIYGKRAYIVNPYHLVLAAFSAVFGGAIASKIIPLISGFLSVLIFYFILKQLDFSKLNRITVSCVFLLSPIFIYVFSLSTPLSVILLLDLLGFYLFMKKEKKFFILSVFVFLIASLFNALNLLMILIVTLSYILAYKKRTKRFYTLAFFLGAVFIIHYLSIYFKFGAGFSIKLIELSILQRFITDLGGVKGFSIFALLLSFIGLVIVWENKKKFYYIYLIMFAVVLGSFFYNPAVVYSNFIISMLAGITFGTLITRKWELSAIRNFSIILLFCGLLFSAVSYTMRISDQQPTPELIEALEWIKQNSGTNDVVFSHYSNGFWIEFVAERAVVADMLISSSSDFQQKLDDSSAIFSSWDIKVTRALLTKYNVSFILLTAGMSEGIVWDKPDEGLAYLLRNSETFKKEYNNDYAGVWRYIYREND